MSHQAARTRTIPSRPTLRPRPVGVPSRPRRGHAEPAPRTRSNSLPARVVRGILALPDSRPVSLLVGGRLWIWLLGIGLGGIVFMQVSLLKMNAGIGRAMTTATTLQRTNTEHEAAIARLGSTERIQAYASKRLGMRNPPAGTTRFRTAHRSSDAAKAVTTMRPPKLTATPTPAPGGQTINASATTQATVVTAAQTTPTQPTQPVTTSTTTPPSTGGATAPTQSAAPVTGGATTPQTSTPATGGATSTGTTAAGTAVGGAAPSTTNTQPSTGTTGSPTGGATATTP